MKSGYKGTVVTGVILFVLAGFMSCRSVPKGATSFSKKPLSVVESALFPKPIFLQIDGYKLTSGDFVTVEDKGQAKPIIILRYFKAGRAEIDLIETRASVDTPERDLFSFVVDETALHTSNGEVQKRMKFQRCQGLSIALATDDAAISLDQLMTNVCNYHREKHS